MTRRLSAVVGILVLVGSSVTLAHHSYGSFFMDRSRLG
jgi:hypothetical protein